MSLTDQFALANNEPFKQKVRTATIIAANAIAAATDRVSYEYVYANQVIANPNGGWIDSMTFQVVANPAISEGSSDGDIEFTVNSNFNKVAAAYTGHVYTPPVEPEPIQ